MSSGEPGADAPLKKEEDHFIPCTMVRAIGGGVFFRPIRSWHSNTYAGERLEIVRGDRSGCAEKRGHSWTCNVPLTVTHRQYWHERDPLKTISAFLSYPDGMGVSTEYFWETYGMGEDIERWFGDAAEAEMEAAIIAHFTSSSKPAEQAAPPTSMEIEK